MGAVHPVSLCSLLRLVPVGAVLAVALLRLDRLRRGAGLGGARRLVGPDRAARPHREAAHRLSRATRLAAHGASIVEVVFIVTTALTTLLLLDDDQATSL